jgi:manganese/zinc/iron transport system permease protein
MLAVHLLQHENTAVEADEARTSGLHRHLRWSAGQITAVVRRAERHGLVRRDREWLRLTDAGRDRARTILGDRKM